MLITETSCGTRRPRFCNALTVPAAIKSPPTRKAVGNGLPCKPSSQAPTCSSVSLALKLATLIRSRLAVKRRLRARHAS